MLRHQQTQPVEDEVEVALHVEALRRKVAWQVSTAYGLPLDEVRVPVVAVHEPPVVVPLHVPEPEPQPQVVPAPEPEPAPGPARVPAAAGALPTLPELERRVAAAASSHPELAEEWRWYLFYLRDFTRADGTLDDGFRLLVETAFAPLLAA